MWWALGAVLLTALIWQGWRNGFRPARWVALGMALGPLALMLGLSFAEVGWGEARDVTVPAACALCGALSFAALRRRLALAVGVLAWHLTLAAPIDVAYQPHVGGPFVQPLRMGLPANRPTPEEATRFVDGGCVVSGLEPRWVLTWQSPPSTP